MEFDFGIGALKERLAAQDLLKSETTASLCTYAAEVPSMNGMHGGVVGRPFKDPITIGGPVGWFALTT